MDLISYSFDKKDLDIIEKILYNLVSNTYIDVALLGDEGGRLINFVISDRKYEKEASKLSVVCAAVLGALDQLNNITHEKNSFFTEGLNKSIYIRMSQSKFFVASIFDRNIPLGSVKLFTDKAISSLEPILTKVRQNKSDLKKIDFNLLEL